MKSQLLSVTILHRHGARGPGDSETSAWNESDEVITQWKQEEFEKLTPTGVKQIQLLGQWFAKTYIKDELIREPSVFFRGSKSDRAVESGRDFVSGFNDAVGRQVFFSLFPTLLSISYCICRSHLWSRLLMK